MAQRVPIEGGTVLAFNLVGSPTVGGLCHAAERRSVRPPGAGSTDGATVLRSPVLKRGILSFWSVWFTVVFASNAADALLALGWLPESWPFASGNAVLVGQAVAAYGLGPHIAALFFTAVVAWQLIATVLFWTAVAEKPPATVSLSSRASSAFGVSLAFWGALLVADEVFLVYRHTNVALVHWCIAMAEIVSLLGIRYSSDA